MSYPQGTTPPSKMEGRCLHSYTPQVVSIGPFPHKNKRLKSMEEFKELVGTIREMEESIRRCYAETIDLTSDSFVKMILVDVCFILEFKELLVIVWKWMTVKPKATAVILIDLLLLVSWKSASILCYWETIPTYISMSLQCRSLSLKLWCFT